MMRNPGCPVTIYDVVENTEEDNEISEIQTETSNYETNETNPSGLNFEGKKVILGLLSSLQFQPHPLSGNYPISPIIVSVLKSTGNEFTFGLQSQITPPSRSLEDSVNRVVVCGNKGPTSVTPQPPVFQPLTSCSGPKTCQQ